jgi:ribosomal protein L21E
MCKTLGLDSKQCSLSSDKGTEFSKAELSKIVNDYTYVSMAPSVENRNRLFQSNFYRILKNRQAISIPVAIAKAQNLMNTSYNRIQKKSPNEAAEGLKKKELDTLKVYNSKRKQHVSNTKLKQLEIGDYVRILIKSLKDVGIGYKTYHDKTYTKEVYEITHKTKKRPHKYRMKGGGKKYYLIDKLLKSAPRDHTTNLRINARSKIQKKADDANEVKLRKKIEKDFQEHLKHLEQLKKQGHMTPDIKKSVTNMKKIKDMWKRDGRAKELIDEAEAEYERQMGRKGLKLGKKKRIKEFRQQEDDPDYVYDQAAAQKEQDEEDEEEKAEVPKKRKQRKTKAWYVKKFSSLADKVLKQQTRLDNVEGETLDRLIRDMQANMQEGQQLTKEIQSKKYKKLSLNLNFFIQ